MPKFHDLTGQRFGKLVVVERSEKRNNQRLRLWLCRCDCGEQTFVAPQSLTRGNTKSCGCGKVGGHGHGLYKTPEYRVWAAMIQRCTNENSAMWPDYGGRGIRVCERWRRFENFYEDMGERPTSKMTIERVDNDRGYEPDNCRWATRTTQNRNTRRSNMIEFQGETRPLTEWAEVLELSYDMLRGRLRRGWTFEQAVAEAPKKNGSAHVD